MTMTSDQVAIKVAQETVAYGTVDPTPAFREMRLLSESLGLEANNILSAELSTERGVTDSIFAGADSSGSIETYLSTNDVYEDFFGAILGNTWSTDTLVPGNIRGGWTVEKTFLEADGVTPFYHLYEGVTVSSMTLSIVPNEPITVTYNLVGGKLTTSATRTAGATDVPVTPSLDLAPIMVAQDTTFAWTGALAGIDTHCKTGFEITIDSQNEPIFCINQLGAADVRLGKLQITGTCAPLLLSDDVFTSWLAQSEFALSTTAADSLGNTYDFAMTRNKIQQATAVAEATGSNVTDPFEFAALLPGPAITITRA